MPQQCAVELANELGIEVGCITIHAPLAQPEDYGLPMPNADKTDLKFLVPGETLPFMRSKCPERGILIIDEIPQADHSLQKILANLVEARVIHGEHLKPGWIIVCTGNRVGDKAGASRLLTHLDRRLTRIPVDVSVKDWMSWALTSDVHIDVIGFINLRPDLLLQFDPNGIKGPDPRSWVKGVSNRMEKIPEALYFECFKGDVGEAAAIEYMGYLKTKERMPSPDAIMVNPAGEVIIKDDAAVNYAICGALVRKATAKNFDTIMIYANRMAAEFTVLLVTMAVKMKPEIKTTKAFIAWGASNNAELLFN